MPKRAIRIVKHIGAIPCVAVCGFCGRQFKAPTSVVSSLKESTASLQRQFDGHKCQLMDSSKNALPIDE